MKESHELSNSEDQGHSGQSVSKYQRFADTVGLVPSLRKKDNLAQGIFVLACVPLGALIGLIGWGAFGLLGGVFAGLILGGLCSGTVLMVLGWMRASRGGKIT
ncbi:MAG: hypothetical protein ABIH47_09070 [Candidatus Omnitrophota bacterium]